MKKLASLLVLAAAVTWLLVSLLNTPAQDSSRLSLEQDSKPAEAPSKSAPTLAPDGAEEEPMVVQEEPATREEVAPEVEAETEDLGSAVVRGQFVLPAGAPAPGVKLALRGWTGNTQRALKFGVPDNWPDVTAETDAKGKFELRFEPPRAFQFILDGKAPGYAEESWRWGEILPGATVDVGVIHLRETGAIEGRVLDKDGKPMKHHWYMYADALASADGGKGRDQTRVMASNNPETGAFRLEGIPPGPVELSAHSQLAGWLKGPTVQVAIGKTTTADLTYEGPDITRRIAVTTFTRPFHILSGKVEGVRITGQGMDRVITREQGTSQTFAIEDLEDGLYTVSITDERFVPWAQNGVRPGEKVSAKLVGSAGAQIEVVDAATGAVLPQAQVRVRLEDYLNWSPNTFQIHKLGPLPEGGILPPIPSGSATLIVDVPGYAPSEFALPDLLPGEVRFASVPMNAEASLSGIVRDSAGKPLANAQVLVMPSGASPSATNTWVGGGANGRTGALHETLSDAEGRFQFSKLQPASVDVYAIGTPWLVGESLDVSIEAGKQSEVVLRVPGGAGLTVKLTGLIDALPSDFNLLIKSDTPQVYSSPFGFRDGLQSGQARLEQNGDGTWIGRDLPPGPATVLLGRNVIRVVTLNGTSSSTGYVEPLGKVELSSGEHATFELNISDRAPGSLSVNVSVQGAPVEGARISVMREGAGQAGAGKTDASGNVIVNGLFPGSYTVWASYKNIATLKLETPCVVPIGGMGTASLSFVGFRNTLLVLDAEGNPLADAYVSLDSPALSASLNTDKDGRATSLLAPGDYTASYHTFNPEARTSTQLVGTLSWPSSEGEEVELRLEPQPQ